MLESMCHGHFLSKSATVAWTFLEDLAEKTIQWKIIRDDSLSSRFARGGLHYISNVGHLELKIAMLENMLKVCLLRLPRFLRLLWCLVLTIRP